MSVGGGAPVRIEVMHGVNLDQLGRREAAHYGTLNFPELERRISSFAGELGMKTRFFHSNFEGDFVEHLHGLGTMVEGILINPGAWTHYSWAIRDALAIANLPTVEVHLSDVDAREDFRRVSVISDLCIATVKGKGPDGYRDALVRLAQELA
jgi:3-dehydroquinate dehydratase-2